MDRGGQDGPAEKIAKLKGLLDVGGITQEVGLDMDLFVGAQPCWKRVELPMATQLFASGRVSNYGTSCEVRS